MRRHEPPIRTLPLPEVREMVATALRYINGEIHYSYLVGPTSDCRFWAKVYRLHPAIQQLASDWSLWVDQVWNEWKQHPVSLPESELRRRIAADLGLDWPPVASRIASTSPMNASSRIVEVFDRLVALGRDALPSRPLAEQFVYYIVATRCDIEINGFDSVFEQHLNPAELEALVNGLRRIDEPHLAVQFWRGFQLLESEGFYSHTEWDKVSSGVKAEIDAIGKRVGGLLWDVDEKLVALLDDDDQALREAGREEAD